MSRDNRLSYIPVQSEEMHKEDLPPNSFDASQKSIKLERELPAGLKALCEACTRVYPDQPNPLQITTKLKYWLGGLDPLDYISMYWNPGQVENNIPPHWHYVSMGLSDLHGDGRVHPPSDRVLIREGRAPASGCGFELTFRLAAPDPPTAPPVWPAAMLQSLARYILTTGNKFYAGDHISLHVSLDGDGRKSRIRHLLVADDPQLKSLVTPHGTVNFFQMVGCTSRELKAAQRGTGTQVLRMIADDPRCGGQWMVTRLSRRRSAKGVNAKWSLGPADLVGVSAKVKWEPWSVDDSIQPMSDRLEQEIKATLQRGLDTIGHDINGLSNIGHDTNGLSNVGDGTNGLDSRMSTDSFQMSSIHQALRDIPSQMGSCSDGQSVNFLSGVHLILEAEGAALLPLAITGRVQHNRHFTWRWENRSVTILSPDVYEAFVDQENPYAVREGWLQMLIPHDLMHDMAMKVKNLSTLADTDSETDNEEEATKTPSLPMTMTWPSHRLKISIVHKDDIL